MKIQEITDQLEHERARHLEISRLAEDFKMMDEHKQAARRIETAILLIHHTATQVKP